VIGKADDPQGVLQNFYFKSLCLMWRGQNEDVPPLKGLHDHFSNPTQRFRAGLPLFRACGAGFNNPRSALIRENQRLPRLSPCLRVSVVSFAFPIPAMSAIP